MESSFKNLGIAPPILKALEDMGFETPTEVQSRAIPPSLNQQDLIVRSETGSGKTAVFGVSLLQLSDPEIYGPQALILEPTRELAVQVDSDLRKIAKYLKFKTTAVYGQHNMDMEIEALKGASIVTGTPGRVYDHIEHRTMPTKNIAFLVLDEADRMLDMGFWDQVMRIVKRLPREKVTFLFSATIPEEVYRVSRQHMKNPLTIEIESPTKTVATTEQIYYRVQENEKRTQLNRILRAERPESCVIFCNTRMMVDRVQAFLCHKRYNSRALHGDIPQTKRLKTLQQFKQGQFNLLVATDVAARGIHIDDLALVINYDVPIEKDSYVHRIGRTGRAGNIGRAVSLVTGEDIMTLYEIEEHVGVLIEEAELPSDEYLDQNKASIDEWIQKNLPKSKPVADSGTRKAGQKRPRTRASSSQGKRNQQSTPASGGKKDSQHNRAQRSHSPRVTGANKKTERVPARRPEEETQPIVATVSASAPVSAVKPSAPNHPAPVVPNSAQGPGAVPAQGAENAPSQESTVKKTLLQRILERWLGK